MIYLISPVKVKRNDSTSYLTVIIGNCRFKLVVIPLKIQGNGLESIWWIFKIQQMMSIIHIEDENRCKFKFEKKLKVEWSKSNNTTAQM